MNGTQPGEFYFSSGSGLNKIDLNFTLDGKSITHTWLKMIIYNEMFEIGILVIFIFLIIFFWVFNWKKYYLQSWKLKITSLHFIQLMQINMQKSMAYSVGRQFTTVTGIEIKLFNDVYYFDIKPVSVRFVVKLLKYDVDITIRSRKYSSWKSPVAS